MSQNDFGATTANVAADEGVRITLEDIERARRIWEDSPPRRPEPMRLHIPRVGEAHTVEIREEDPIRTQIHPPRVWFDEVMAVEDLAIDEEAPSDPVFTKFANRPNNDGNVSDGTTANYYKLPEGATELQDIISAKNMNSQMGEIGRAWMRYGDCPHSEKLRDINKIIFYAQAEKERLEKYGD